MIGEMKAGSEGKLQRRCPSHSLLSRSSVCGHRPGCQCSSDSSAADHKAALKIQIVTHDAAQYIRAATPELTQPEQSLHRPCESTPIAMASLEPFERAHKKVWKNLTAEEKNKLAATCTIEDVRKIVVDIQKEQAKRHELGNMNKIRPYLDALERYDDIIKIFVSAKPEILALIWVDYTRHNSAVQANMVGR